MGNNKVGLNREVVLICMKVKIDCKGTLEHNGVVFIERWSLDTGGL